MVPMQVYSGKKEQWMTKGISNRTASSPGEGRSLSVLSLLFTAGFTTISAITVAIAGPAGWQTVKDSTGVCQISIPPSWAMIPGSPGEFASSDHLASVLISVSPRSPAPMTDAEKHEFGADKIIENSAGRWLYASKATQQKAITYHVNVPAKRVCAAELSVKVGHSEDEIKQIAATVGATK
jgi:hypothetical protein